MNFGQALEALKAGKKVARAGWNGKGLWIKLIPSQHIEIERGASDGIHKLHTGVQSFFVIKGVDNNFNTWVPSISDCLAEDWEEAA